MPIKFRCNYCRQFLGISRAQAGGIVDCPTCGRSIRVPLLDGTLQPLPEPELNMQDAQLARALDELARLENGELVSSIKPAEKVEMESEEDAENEIPQPIPEPIPIEVPIPPTPIAVNAPFQDDDSPPPIATNNADSAAPPSSREQQREQRDQREQSVMAELAALAPAVQSVDEAAPSVKFEPRVVTHGRSLPRVSLMIVLAFIVGMLFERFVKVLESVRPATHAATSETKVESSEAIKGVTGRITYKSSDASSQPDRGARIIAFPQQRTGEIKLSVVGFRPADGEADARVAAAALRALGGALATADDAGQYRLDVPAGSYQLLVLSHFQSRNAKEQVDPTVLKLLAAYFDKPDELVGRVKYEFSPLKVKGTGDVWDHSF